MCVCIGYLNADAGKGQSSWIPLELQLGASYLTWVLGDELQIEQ